MAYFQVYRSSGRYWWRLRDGNHKTVADGSEGYASKYNCERAIQNVKGEAFRARVVDNT